jgi:large subunit ribosomal protein L28
MARCKLTGKLPNTANLVSHANNRTKTKQFPNVQSKRIWDAEGGRWVRLSLSTRAIRTLNRMGLQAFAKKSGLDLSKLGQK